MSRQRMEIPATGLKTARAWAVKSRCAPASTWPARMGWMKVSSGSLLKTPKVMHRTARTRIGMTIGAGLSFTAATSFERGPKNTEWPALRNEAKVKMAPTQAATAKMTEPDSRAPWKTISLETKPLSGQTPEMARAQTVKPAAVRGISRARPPSFLSSVVPGPVLDRARAQEEPALIHGVVDHVEDAAGDADGDGRADAEDHVADLADGVVGEQALEVLLDEGHHDREDDRHGADDHEDEGQAGPLLEREEVQGDPGQEVDAQQLLEGRRQEGHEADRGVDGRVRDPGVEGHGPGLADGADHHHDEGQDGDALGPDRDGGHLQRPGDRTRGCRCRGSCRSRRRR